MSIPLVIYLVVKTYKLVLPMVGDLLLDIRRGSWVGEVVHYQPNDWSCCGACMLIATSLELVMAKEDGHCKVLQPFRLYMMGIYIWHLCLSVETCQTASYARFMQFLIHVTWMRRHIWGKCCCSKSLYSNGTWAQGHREICHVGMWVPFDRIDFKVGPFVHLKQTLVYLR